MTENDSVIQVRANGSANAQVTDRVKDCLFSWLEDRGVSDARENVVLSHYNEGDYVAVSNNGVSDGSIDSFNDAYSDLVDYWRNRAIHDDCVWVSRYWIQKQIEES